MEPQFVTETLAHRTITRIAIVADGICDGNDLASGDQRLLERKVRAHPHQGQNDKTFAFVNGHRHDLPKYQVSEIEVPNILFLRILPTRALTCFTEDLGD